MIGHSLLYARPEDDTGDDPGEPACFADLRLDRVVASILRGREDHHLTPYFHTPLTTIDAVAYRHEVMRDLARADLCAAFEQFGAEMRAMRRLLAALGAPAHPIRHNLTLLEAARAYVTAVTGLAARLRDANPRSRGVTGLSGFLQGYVTAPAFSALHRDTTALAARLHPLRYTVHIRAGRVRVGRDDEPDYADELAAALTVFGTDPAGTGPPFLPGRPGTTRVDDAVLDAVVRLHPGPFAELRAFRTDNTNFPDETVAAAGRAAQFYLACHEFIRRLGRIGVRFCYPEITTRPTRVVVRDTVDVALADKVERDGGDLVRNDVELTGPERILVVSGSNQGGKTTYARMVGQLHHLAAVGLPVPGTTAVVPLTDRILTHFAEEEHPGTGHGELEEELLHLHAVLAQATPRSLLILNEMLSGTTSRDALAMARDVLRRVIRLGALCVCVTFLDELSRLDGTVVSVVSTVDKGDVRTFRVVRAPADGAAYAASVAARYGLTYAQLRDRLRP